MRISIQQLDAAISKMKYSLLGYSNAEKQDIEVLVELVSADPGNGKLIDCVKLTALAPQFPTDESERSMVVEIYPFEDKESPRASKIESFRINGKY